MTVGESERAAPHELGRGPIGMGLVVLGSFEE